MKKIITISILGLVASAMVSCTGGASFNGTIKSAVDSAAYSVGFLNGQGFAQSLKGLPGDSLDTQLILAGMADALLGKDGKISVEDAQAFMQGYFERVSKEAAERNSKEGEEFLAKNKDAEGVVTTESGLQYKYEVEGTGAKATSPADTVVVHYKGTLLDGTQFDSSYDREEPATFPLDRVIAGWTEAFQIFPVGSKGTIWLPASLAYGDRAPESIGANRTLRFDFELIDVKPAQAVK